MISNLVDLIRIVGVSIAFFFGYQIGFADGYNPTAQLHFMIPIIIASIAGTSGIEGVFFAKSSAKLKGFEVGSNYQKQSAIALLSYAAVAIFVYFSNWGIKAELTILFAFIFFFFSLQLIMPEVLSRIKITNGRTLTDHLLLSF